MIAGPQPFLIVRAQIDGSVMVDFRRWYQDIHLPHLLAIPGIVQAHTVKQRSNAFNWMALYEFAPETEIQEAMQSAEAQLARDDWNSWSDHVRDFSVEIYAGLAALPALHHWN